MTPSDLRAWREARGLTLQQMADLLGVGLKTYQRYETPADRPSATPPPGWLVRIVGWIDMPGRPADWPGA